MSRWDKAIEQAERIQKDIEFIKHQMMSTKFGEMVTTIDDIEEAMEEIEHWTKDIVEIGESMETVTNNVAIHRVKKSVKAA